MLSATEAVIHFNDEGGGDGLEGSDFTFDLFFDVVSQFVDVDYLDGYFVSVFALSVVDGSTGPLPEGLSLANAVIGYLFDGRFAHARYYNSKSK